jgi:hypothetical protein
MYVKRCVEVEGDVVSCEKAQESRCVVGRLEDRKSKAERRVIVVQPRCFWT